MLKKITNGSQPYFGLVLTFVFLLPLSQFLSVRLLFFLLLVSILALVKKSKDTFIQILNRSWDIFLFLLLMIIGIGYSSDLSQGFMVLETSFSLLALPIIFNEISISTKRLHYVFMSFIAGLFVASIFCLSYSGIKFGQSGDTSVFFFEKLTNAVNAQPTYVAYYLCFAMTVVLYFLYYEKFKISPSMLIGFLILFFIVLMLTGGRTAYVSMLFIFSFFMLKFLFEEVRVNAKRMAFAMSVIFMVSMLVINHYNFNTSSETINGDYWERITLWKSALNANIDYLFGVGTGDYKDVLNQYFRTQGMNQYAEESYNSHNQFIQSFFTNGLFGLISLMIIIARPLYLSFKIQNSLGILIIYPFIIYGMTEVFLGRYQGVVFFALCHQIVILQYYSNRPYFSFKVS